MAKQTQSAAVTFTPEALQAYVDQAIAKVFEIKQAQKDHKRSDEMESLTIRAFKKAGYTDIKPRQNILTYDKWIEQGFRVKEGEKSIRVKNLRLFHVSQVEKLSAKDKAEALAALAAKREAKTADKLPKPSPVTPAPVAAKPAKGRGKAPVQPTA